MTEQRTIPILVDNGMGLLTIEVYEEDGQLICGIRNVLGFLDEPPKKWLRTIRQAFRVVCDKARDAGCVEIRLCGRDWSSVLPELEPFEGLPNGLRKRL